MRRGIEKINFINLHYKIILVQFAVVIKFRVSF